MQAGGGRMSVKRDSGKKNFYAWKIKQPPRLNTYDVINANKPGTEHS